MRKPETIEYLYLDFDGFFASVEQQARPALRGKPVGVVPFDSTLHTVVIACSKEAKAQGIKNVMRVKDVKRICPRDKACPPNTRPIPSRTGHTQLEVRQDPCHARPLEATGRR